MRRHRATPAEAIVHAQLEGMLVFPEPGANNLGGATGEGGVAEIVIHVFAFDGPVRRKHVFETAADGVTVAMPAIDRKGHRYATNTGADTDAIAPGETALGVEQRRTPSVADPAGRRAKLVGVPGYPRSQRERGAATVVARKPAILGFGTDHPVRSELVVGTTLHTAQELAAASLKAVVASERAADMAADIEAGPVIDRLRRRIGRSLRIGSRR